MNAMILKCADHLQTGTIADMRQTGILVTAKVALKNAAIVVSYQRARPTASSSRTHSGASLA